ncbi:MAG: DUF4097 family beta strand repeat-containing protein [Bacteroidales bacterium]|jgi:hypothetical protein|nr:DUF4097 domain-containing protein [Bacteroidales bacterium]MDD4604372.1 DUF4097 family beta strand repeat-containing protein [Bacteroidales bacterium]
MKTIKQVLMISLIISCFFIYPAVVQGEREPRRLNEINVSDENQILAPAQYKIPVNGAQIKKIVIQDLLAEIKIVGSQNNDIIIDARGLKEIPKRAKGLTYVNGCMDNTGTGVAANESEGVLTICGASKGSDDATYIFTVPKGVSLSIEYNSPFAKEDIEIKNMEAEVEVSTLSTNINCSNVTGPLVLNSISGNIDINVSRLNQNSPTSISLISGDLDITLPATSNANLKMNSISGGVYTDFDIKVDYKKGNLKRIGNNNIETKLNGGGVDLSLISTSGNVYLRKK